MNLNQKIVDYKVVDHIEITTFYVDYVNIWGCLKILSFESYFFGL
jgi:hypothetical protein